MAIPSVTNTVSETGIPSVATGPLRALVIGTSSSGTAEAVVTCTTPNKVRTTFGYGPLATDALHILAYGGVVDCVRVSTSATGTAPTPTATAVTGSATLSVSSGNPYDRYDVRVEIVTGGALDGTATLRYSLDHWPENDNPTWSDTIVLPASGIVALENTGMTITLDDAGGDPDTGDVWDFECTAPPIAPADITALNTNNALDPYVDQFDFVVLAGQPTTCTLADALADVLDPALASLESGGGRKPALIGAGEAGGTLSDFAYEGTRIGAVLGEAGVVSQDPIPGLSYEVIGAHIPVAARVASNLISTDPIRVASGPLGGVQWIDHNEFLEQDTDDDKIGTLRTWPGKRGFYVTNAWIRSADNSTIRYFQHALVLAKACEIVASAQTNYVGASIRTGAGGVIAEADALAIERDVLNQLGAALLQPRNAEGTKGHVSGISYRIDRAINLLSTETIEAELGVQPLGYPRTITSTTGFKILPS